MKKIFTKYNHLKCLKTLMKIVKPVFDSLRPPFKGIGINPVGKASLFFRIGFMMICTGHPLWAQRTIPPGTYRPIQSRQQIVSEVPVVSIQADQQIYGLTPAQKLSTTFYYDGLGRNSHIIMTKVSPTQKDLVQIIKFDNQGRVTKRHLPFANVLLESVEQDQLAFFNNPNDRVADDASPFAMTVYEPSPMARLKEQGSPGAAWQPGSSHTLRLNYGTNGTTDPVRQFNPDGSSNAFYPAGQLYLTEQTDPDNQKLFVFKDKAGRVILQRKLFGEMIDNVTVPFLETYFVYDDFGRVKLIIPPKAVSALASASWVLSPTIKDEFVYEFTYDPRGRVIEKKVPGAGWTNIVYDQMNRPVLLQQATQRATNEWDFIKYDQKGRVILTGFYTDAVNNTRALLQSFLDTRNYDGPDKYFEVKQSATTHGYSNQAFPVSNTTMNGVNYYDDYDFDSNGSPDYSYLPQSLGAQEPQPTLMVRGVLTGTKKRILGTAQWLLEAAFYDSYYRVIQKRTNNPLHAVVEDAATLVYNFQGQVIRKKEFQKVSASQTITVVTDYQYDAPGRLLLVKQTINNLPEKTIAQYEYNELGQLVEKNVGGMGATGTEGFLQSIDMAYNIRGWLTHINNSALDYHAVSNDDHDDVFGLEMVYEQTHASLGNQAKFNGNISAIKWQHNDLLQANQPKRERAYTFDYYANEQLKNAFFKAWNQTGWTAETGGFDMKNIKYDHNGNVQGYERFAKASDAAAPVKIDHLSYTYQGNKLTKVEDTGTGQGFANGSTAAIEYTYDDNGNLTTDENKGIVLTYNQYNKTTSIAKTGVGSLTYEYDANGMRVSSTVTQGTTSAKQTYVGAFVYQGTTLLYFGMPEGRVNRKPDGSFEYEYMLTDHQGNVRTSYKEKTITSTYTATIEDNGQATATNPRIQEMQRFKGLFEVEMQNLNQWLNKTAPTAAVPLPNRAAYLTGSGTRKIGPGVSLMVKPGDALHMEAWGKFLKPGSGTFNNTVVAGLATAFAGNFAGAFGPEGTAHVESMYSAAAGAVGAYGGSETNAPRAFINFLLFDKDFNFVDAGWDRIDATAGFFQNQENTVPWNKVQLDITIAQAGYVYIYLSNESEATQVWFDDMSVTHTARVAEITAANDYYPFGLRMEGVVTNTPLNNSANQYAYNGGSLWSNELNNLANYLTTPFREYDPVLGRFNGVDIMATKYANLSPYNFAFNNPVYWNDPTGADGEGPTAQEIADIIAKLLKNSHGGEWSRDAWDQGSSSGGGGGCRGCSFYNSVHVIPLGYGSYEIVTQVYFGHASANSQGVVFEAKWGVKTFTKYDIDRAKNPSSIFDVDEQPGAREAKISAFKSFTQGFLAIFDLATYGAKLDTKDAAKYAGTFKSLKFGLPALSILVSIAQFAIDPTPQNLVRLQASVVTTAIGFIPGVGPFASFGLSIADANGAFDGYYAKFDTWGEAALHGVSPLAGNLFAK